MQPRPGIEAQRVSDDFVRVRMKLWASIEEVGDEAANCCYGRTFRDHHPRQ